LDAGFPDWSVKLMKPTRIDATNADEFEGNWSDEADVVIVGSGFAGLAAAIEAKNAGASVIILEKMKGRGGNSIISDGLVAAAGSPLQQKSRINDSAQLMVADMLRAGQGLNYPDLIKVVADKSNQAVQWTIDFFGVQYRDKLEQLGGHSVPRTFVTNKQSGSVIVKGMLKKIGELGMSVRTRVYLERIKRNPSGDVNGVIVRDGYAFPFAESGTKKFIRARKAVILATGGFSNDVAFRSIQDPRLTELFDTTNKKGATAEALKEALRVGAAPVQLSWIQLGPWTSPDEKMYGIGPQFADYVAEPYGIMVDPDSGKRFVNELADRKIKADAILALGYPCVAIADAQGVGKSAQNENPPKI
jgi:flavocytochrome c